MSGVFAPLKGMQISCGIPGINMAYAMVDSAGIPYVRQVFGVIDTGWSPAISTGVTGFNFKVTASSVGVESTNTSAGINYCRAQWPNI